MNIGKRLKIAREEIGYTLLRASKETGVGVSSISDYERDKREPKFSQLSNLAEVYKKSVEFFLSDEPIIENLMLWRDKPGNEEEMKNTEAEFMQLCEQYYKLELLMDEVRETEFPQLNGVKVEDFGYKAVNQLTEKIQRELLLGEIPSSSIKQILEERYYIKVFHLDFDGSAISIKSPKFGYAVLLNKNNKLWRRNFDLAHELFHLITWDIFRTSDSENPEPRDAEEKFANAFASSLLLPTNSVKEKIEAAMNNKGKITFGALDEIARKFGVSIDALLWRTLYLYNKSAKQIEKHIKQTDKLKINRPLRKSDEPDKLPERYCSLAIRALNEGKLSLMQFAKYMALSYRKAEEYLAEEEGLTDEKNSISVA